MWSLLVSLALAAPPDAPAPHGGQLLTTSSGGSVELLALREADGVRYRVWVCGPGAVLRSVENADGRVMLRIFWDGRAMQPVPGQPDVVLRPVGDHLEGSGPPAPAAFTAMVVAAMPTDPTETGQFTVALPPR